ncbi:MAG: hypothetical protein GY753_09770 [Gammaproteobacteria bacterium]|nr:hypothetical protein [Gammaproteobacteria bacterium]
MAWSIVNSAYATLTNDLTPAVSFSTPSANNLLVAFICVEYSPATNWATSLPSGWTEISNTDSGVTYGGDIKGQFIYKIATGSESTIEWTDFLAGQDSSIGYLEISGLASVDPLDAFDDDETYISSATTTQSSGSATATEADGVAIAAFGWQPSQNADEGRAYTNSFVEQGTPFKDTWEPMVALTALGYSSTGAKTTAFSTTGVGGVMYGAIALFKEAGGGPVGATIPLMIHHYTMAGGL